MELQNVALSMTKYLFTKEEYKEKNLIFSPLSIQAALAVMAAGSDGRTLHELLSFLRFDSIDDLTTFFSQVVSPVFSDDVASTSSHHPSFVNGIWADQSLSLSHSFKQLAATHYKATLASLDFHTMKGDEIVREVNSWIAKQTNGFITDLLPRETVTNLTRLIFANALHFQSEWKHRFDGFPSQNHFHLLNGTSVVVRFMHSQKETHYIRAFDGFKILRLHYKQATDTKHCFSMCILLPDAKDGLLPLIQKLSEPDFLKGKLPQQEVPVSYLSVPRFNISFSFEASSVLKEVGVVSPFSDLDADFTKMVEANTPLDKLCVENIFHKAFVAVTEKGTEAAASTVGVMRKALGGSKPLPGIEFEANHPFLFLIREDLTGTIHFVGQVLNPLDGASKPVMRGPGFRRSSIAATPVKEASEFVDSTNNYDVVLSNDCEIPDSKHARKRSAASKSFRKKKSH